MPYYNYFLFEKHQQNKNLKSFPFLFYNILIIIELTNINYLKVTQK